MEELFLGLSKRKVEVEKSIKMWADSKAKTMGPHIHYYDFDDIVFNEAGLCAMDYLDHKDEIDDQMFAHKKGWA